MLSCSTLADLGHSTRLDLHSQLELHPWHVDNQKVGLTSIENCGKRCTGSFKALQMKAVGYRNSISQIILTLFILLLLEKKKSRS